VCEGHADVVKFAFFLDGPQRQAQIRILQQPPKPPRPQHTLDREVIFTASVDCTASAWTAQGHERLQTLRGHTSWVRSVALSPDGRHVLTGSADSTAKLWVAERGECVQTLRGHKGPVNSAEFSHDANVVLTASDDRTARLWRLDADASTSVVQWTMKGHKGPVKAAIFFPGSTSDILTACGDHIVRVWSAGTQECVNCTGHSAAVNSVALLEGASSSSSSSSSTTTSTMLVASASADHTVRLWDRRGGECRFTFRGHKSAVNSVQSSFDGALLVCASDDSSASVWGVATGCLSTVAGHTAQLNAAVFSGSDGKAFALLKAGTSAQPDAQSALPRALVLTASDDCSAKVWDSSTGVCLKTLQGHKSRVVFAAFSSNGAWAVTTSSDATAKLWDVQHDFRPRTLRGHAARVGSAAFSPDGTRLLTASDDGNILCWSVEAGRRLGELTGHTDAVNSVVFSPDGVLIASASCDHVVRVWSNISGQCIGVLRGHEHFVKAAAFSADGASLVSASNDRTARLWCAESGICRCTFTGHESSVTAAVLCTSGQIVLTASNDRTARLWSADTGECKYIFRDAFDGWVQAVSLSRVGACSCGCALGVLAAAGHDKTLGLWCAETGSSRGVFKPPCAEADAEGGGGGGGDGGGEIGEALNKRAAARKRPRLLVVPAGAPGSLRASIAATAFAPHSHGGGGGSAALVLAAAEDGVARLWDAESGECRLELRGHTGAVTSVAFSP